MSHRSLAKISPDQAISSNYIRQNYNGYAKGTFSTMPALSVRSKESSICAHVRHQYIRYRIMTTGFKSPGGARSAHLQGGDPSNGKHSLVQSVSVNRARSQQRGVDNHGVSAANALAPQFNSCLLPAVLERL